MNEFASSQRLSAHQRGQNVGARRIADQGGDFSNADIRGHEEPFAAVYLQFSPTQCRGQPAKLRPRR